MESFESTSFKKRPTEESSQENNFEEDLTDRFLDLLEKEPTIEEVVREIKIRFNEMEVVTKRAFDDSLEAARSHERLRIIDLFAQRSALHYMSLQKIMVEMLELATHLSEEEKDGVVEESQNIAVFYEGHTLLSFYANRAGLDKKNVDSLRRNTENAALQQFMAQFYLKNHSELGQVEGKLDSYGRRAFGSDESYGAFKRGVVSLADAYNHIKSFGHQAFFPPPKMDAETEIDLVSVDSEIYEKNINEMDEFFESNFSLSDLKGMESKFKSPVYGIQVKTRHGLKETYPEIKEEEKDLNGLLSELSLAMEDFGGLDSRVIEETRINTSEVKSVTGNDSSAVVFSCRPISDRTFSFGTESKFSENSYDKERFKVKDDIQELSTFMGRTEGLGSMYIFVDQEEAQN